MRPLLKLPTVNQEKYWQTALADTGAIVANRVVTWPIAFIASVAAVAAVFTTAKTPVGWKVLLAFLAGAGTLVAVGPLVFLGALCAAPYRQRNTARRSLAQVNDELAAERARVERVAEWREALGEAHRAVEGFIRAHEAATPHMNGVRQQWSRREHPLMPDHLELVAWDKGVLAEPGGSRFSETPLVSRGELRAVIAEPRRADTWAELDSQWDERAYWIVDRRREAESRLAELWDATLPAKRGTGSAAL